MLRFLFAAVIIDEHHDKRGSVNDSRIDIEPNLPYVRGKGSTTPMPRGQDTDTQTGEDWPVIIDRLYRAPLPTSARTREVAGAHYPGRAPGNGP